MTNKEAYLKIQEFINEVQLGIKRSSLDIIEPLNIIRALTKEQSNPTLSDCIKEWEEREFMVTEYARGLLIESKKYDLTIDICKANLIYEISDYFESNPAFMTPELHHLLTKTLKALEVEND